MADSTKVEIIPADSSQVTENSALRDIHKEKPWLFKPGQSGNPGGRPKKLTRILDEVLDKKDKSGKTQAEKLVQAVVARAIKKSDLLVKEVWERVEGKAPTNDELDPNRARMTVILDFPRPQLEEKE